MKNLYKITSEVKFRGIFQVKKVAIEKTEVAENAEVKKDNGVVEDAVAARASCVRRRGASDADIQCGQFLALFGISAGRINDLRELFGILNDEVEQKNKNEEESNKDKKESTEDEKTQTKQNLQNETQGGDELSAADAYAKLRKLNTDITIFSTNSGFITIPKLLTRRGEKDTSLAGIRSKTIEGISFLQKKLNIPIIITGGTEAGHEGGLSGGLGTHGGGSKIDISFKHGVEAGMDAYITSKEVESTPRIIKRGKFKGNYETWVIEDGGYTMTITKETNVKGGDHYDIAFA